jgi:hypothetical protein
MRKSGIRSGRKESNGEHYFGGCNSLLSLPTTLSVFSGFKTITFEALKRFLLPLEL